MWLLCIAITYWFFEKMFHQKMFSLAIATLIAALPIVTYLTPSISNEFFSGMIITITLVFYVISFLPKANALKTAWKTHIILGILLSLALLSKSTALVLLISIVVERVFALRGNVLIAAKQLFVPVVIVVILSGWFY